MSAPLPPDVLKARLKVALSLFDEDGIAGFQAWVTAEGVSDHAGDVMLVEAILQALGEEYFCVSPLLVMAFQKRLTEASGCLRSELPEVRRLPEASCPDRRAALQETREQQSVALSSAISGLRNNLNQGRKR